MRNLEEFNSRHKDRPAFIIGSGPSINLLDLSILKKHICIAVNSGYVAVPWCKYFLSDDWAVSLWSYFYSDLRTSKTTVLLYEDKLKSRAGLFWKRSVLFRHRLGYHLNDLYKHSNYDQHICQSRTSLGSAIHVAHIMGCNPIVLLGVDCCYTDGMRYFWQSYPKEKQPIQLMSITRYKTSADGIIQSDSDLAEILDYWRESASYFMKKCTIINASPSSVLDVFPKESLSTIASNYV